jgi:hypothetical protein
VATKKPTLKNLATIARPNLMGVVRDGWLFLVEGKVSADYLEAFPDCTVSRVVSYDLTDPTKPVRGGACDVRAAWWITPGPKGSRTLYVAQARVVDDTAKAAATGDEAPKTWMDIAVVDVSNPSAPEVVATVPTEQEFTADSKEPILVVTGSSLLFSSRADTSLAVFDIHAPLSPKLVTRVTLPDAAQAAFGDDEGALLTRLGNDSALLDVRGGNDRWTVREISALGGSARRVRVRNFIYGPTAKSVGNHLGWYDGEGALLGETKLGPTSIQAHSDGVVLVTTGDALSVWRLAPSGEPELLAKKKDADGASSPRVTVSDSIVCVPERADAKAVDKKQAFAFNLWTVR